VGSGAEQDRPLRRVEAHARFHDGAIGDEHRMLADRDAAARNAAPHRRAEDREVGFEHRDEVTDVIPDVVHPPSSDRRARSIAGEHLEIGLAALRVGVRRTSEPHRGHASVRLEHVARRRARRPRGAWRDRAPARSPVP
jgi:hypothetical protein